VSPSGRDDAGSTIRVCAPFVVMRRILAAGERRAAGQSRFRIASAAMTKYSSNA
jgi:hypothetical protein